MTNTTLQSSLRPTRLGWGFFGLIAIVLIGSVNYGLGLGYALAFWLLGVWLLAAVRAQRGAGELEVQTFSPSEVASGEIASAQLRLISRSGALVRASWRTEQGGDWEGSCRVSVQGETLPLPLPTPLRGPLTPPIVQVAGTDELGLWEVSRPLTLPELLVLPAAEPSPPPLPLATGLSGGEGTRRIKGDEEVSGLREYQPGDSPRTISWRHVARTGQLLTRERDAAAAQAVVLRWTDTAGPHEDRVARLSAWVKQAEQNRIPFGLQLPGQELPLGSGAAHALEAQKALALLAPWPTEQLRPPPTLLSQSGMLWTLLALAVALAPAWLHYSPVVSAMLFGILGLVAWQVRQRPGQQPLGSVPLLLLLLVGLPLLFVLHGTLIGREAGTAFLALLLVLKTGETHNRRDARLLSLLGIFVILTHFFFSQGPLMLLWVLLSLFGLLAALIGWNLPAEDSLQSRRLSGQVLLRSVPLMLLLFVLFPRPSGPLWRLPFQGGAQTGLANEVSPGKVSDLAQSDAVALRVDFQGPMPNLGELYWRGPLYEAFDGTRWQQVRVPLTVPDITFVGPSYRYTLTQEPNGQPWVLALEMPTQEPTGTRVTSGFQFMTSRPSSMRTRYQLQSRAAVMGRNEAQVRLQFNLRVPGGQNPRTEALGASWRTLAPEQRVQAGLDYLAKGGYSYTLTPPTLPDAAQIDAFLFQSKQGFCEHYASAFGVLMRAAGVPTRLVGGYLGGQPNPEGNYLIVRQLDAHVWNEVWLAGRGWVRVDPTSVVAPARLSAGTRTALQNPQAQNAAPPNALERLRLRWDAAQTGWNNWVSGYDGTQQTAALTSLGIGKVGSGSYVLFGLLMLPLALFPIWRAGRSRQQWPDEASQLLHQATRRLGVPRLAGETPTAYVQRLSAQDPALAAPLAQVLADYQQLRYGQADAAALERLRRNVRQLKRADPSVNVDA